MSDQVPPCTGEVVLFFREHEGEDFFYPIQLTGEEPIELEAPKHAKCNPGTLRIERMNGEVLWSIDTLATESQDG